MAAILPASRITDKQSLQGSLQATTKVYSGISAGRLLGCWAVGLLGCGGWFRSPCGEYV